MKKVSLVTTACQATWPKSKNQPVQFLGEWCQVYSARELWSQYDSKLIPYHWDNRDKLFKDFKALQSSYEKTLLSLANHLNQINHVNYSIRYWRVLIGPWLGCFIHILFDRWYMLKEAFSGGQHFDCNIIRRHESTIPPNDMEHFMELYASDDWNEALYGQLIKLYWSDMVNINWIGQEKISITRKKSDINLKTRVKKIASFFNAFYTKKNDYFFISSYLPLSSEIKLQLSLGQLPKLWINNFQSPLTKYNLDKRNWTLDIETTNDFECIVNKMIPLHIPKIYLEGYSSLRSITKKLTWPKYPKTIFTSNSFWGDDVFKAWSASKIESGTPLLIGQHGGGYGTCLFEFGDDHQAKIADKWISWGWTDINRPNIAPVGILKTLGRKIQYNPKGKILMVEFNIPRYSYHLYSAPIAGQWIEYFNDQKFFLKSLPNNLREKILLRLHHQDYKRNQIARWKDLMPECSIDEGTENINKLIQNSRLYIATYNGTTYLESLRWNIPTIIFWNPKYWELNKKSKPFFEMLESVGIFHTSPYSAAQKLIEICGDIETWWHSREVQDAREVFVQEYAAYSKQTFSCLKKEIIESTQTK
jgi:putative transferase (TIGR04331 family)